MMRLRQLDLELFGGFSGQSFDFGAPRGDGEPDFHVIIGRNEAGKTTTMEGFLRLLYGFPHREPYDFLHQRKNLRVSGVLDIDGTEMAFTRLPNREPSLRDARGAEVPNSALQAHLGGLSEEDYRNLFCLDDATIERGGEEITRAKGDIGRLLFSAAAGISDLSEVLDRVRAEADGLYRKRASTTRLASLKKDHAEVERQIRELDISAAQYRKLKQAADEADAEEKRALEHRRGLFAAKAQLEARGRALPLLGEIDALGARLVPFATWPARLDIDPETLVRMLTDQATAQSREHALGAEIDTLRAELAGIERHPEHLAISGEIEALDALRSRYMTAELDLDRRRRALSGILQDMRQVVARDLGASGDVDPARLVLSSAALSDLDALRDAMRDAERLAETERSEVADLADRIVAAEEAQSKLASEMSAGSDLEEVCARFDIDALSQRFIAATSAVEPARGRAQGALDALSIKGQSFDTVPTCPLTLEEAEALLETVQQVTLRHDTALRELEDNRAELAERAARIGRIKATSGLIEDAQAQSLRAGRDDLWAEHRAKLNAATAAEFEEAMVRVDTAMDLRLSHAADLGTLRQHEQDLAALEARASLMDQQIAALAAERQTALDGLTSAARQTGIGAPMMPETFVAWLRKLGTAAQAAAELRRLQEDHRETFARAERLIEGLAPLLRREEPRFEDIVAEAKAILTGQRAHKEKLRAARSRIDDLMGEREKRVAKLADMERKAAQLRHDWAAKIAKLLPEAMNASLLEASLKPLHDLRALDTERIALERQVLGMEADQAQFSKRVRDLGERAGVEISEAPRADYDALVAKADEAVAAEEKSLDLAQRIVALDEALSETRRTLDDIRLAVEKMARLFPEGVETGSLEALRQAVSTAAQVIGDRGRLAHLERDLLATLALADLDAARHALAETSQADLRARFEEVEADLETAEALYKAKIEARAAAVQELRSIGGDAEVARLVERKTTIELEMQEAALRHLELSLGYHLADAAIRRYRDTHRSAMMQATETAFAELTNGAYSQLRTQVDGASETLLAFDSKGMAKQAQDMSKGTRFQLYLALRAAAYEQLAHQGTSLPFFCDDIFETFDEDRTRSACCVMERLGRRGQAIYLTHHRHVVDIAREVCADRVQIHRIGV
ncbi:hypothetical protein D2N39_16985 [Gemmobacter lutimaris]|uniref:YhaN AAA domain-containing protein n=1 Tax=Gemmobacter lutimaris TaxID=2306023 RepID=A0A398BQ61_9RHOB|nr:YhaN family protein [Gemmobacter lutimaris]RID90698.1 hypothetical protein D2N39_16985 [Gemmobacter lutimaris]